MDRLLLVTHVALKNLNGHYCIDDQTAQGLVRWSENFKRVAYVGIQAADGDPDTSSSTAWVPIGDLPCADRLDVIALPHAYRISDFVSAYRTGRARLAHELSRSEFPCFTLGALVGDWGAVAGLESIKQRRGYGVWFDRVEHEVIRSGLAQMPPLRRVKEGVSLPLMRLYHKYLIRRSRLGLFQGKDCYDHYSQFTLNGFCVYDTHTSPEDFVDGASLNEKVRQVLSGDALKICYVGRAADMKGPIDWVDALSLLKEAGIAFRATWLGDGPLLETMRQRARERGVSDRIDMPGFCSERTATLEFMREAHVFMFCHKTPESPRCLIEALVSGTPIVGYTSAYAKDLTTQGGGNFVPVGDWQSLAASIARLDKDRQSLAEMIRAAARSGLRFNEQKMYQERAALMRQHLGT